MRARDVPLAGQVEGEERLVAQQHPGITEQGLGDAQALLFAAREHADRRIGEGAGADRLQCLVHPRPDRPGVAGQAPVMPVHPETDEVPAADGQ